MYHVSAQGVDERMINVHCYSISALIYLSFGFITPDRVTKICDKLQNSVIVCIYMHGLQSDKVSRSLTTTVHHVPIQVIVSLPTDLPVS